jgi:hypothetical protein
MRFMMLVKANKDSEAGVLPTKELVAAMGKFNEQMIEAGVMLAADGLHASSKGFRVKYDGDRRTVTSGPFGATNELLAGFWLIDVTSREEALEWARRAPFREGELEVRQVFEASDFPAEIRSPEDAAREQAWRDEQRRKAAQR